MRTAKSMGVRTVAVYSDADADALHVVTADEAVRIGPPPAAQSYLNKDAVIDAAIQTGAEAIHPGYGFLSENPDFVEAVEKAGLVFIGPSADAIRAMGLKDAAKKLMVEAGVPVVPGYHGEEQDAKFLAGEADKIGYPVLIKARAGGGGKGMRKVDRPEDFAVALEGAKREGESSFGDGRVLVEKYVTAPRHIEVQVFGDNHGNIVHLFERDCSLQRRHQKVIEEAPAPGMTDDMREAITDAAILAARAINYSGAGTLEFIVDGSQGLRPDKFWFMEMNTRLQVEHPVTEFITGVDLVEWQLRVASGEKLPVAQNDLSITGHAFEARIYAEDVPKGFLPAVGTLDYLKFSDLARTDSGVRQGDTLSPFYDPMIAKVITHGSTREEALSAMRAALLETHISGTVTNTQFLTALCGHEEFKSGEVDTGLIEREISLLTKPLEPRTEILALAALCSLGLHERKSSLAGHRNWGSSHHMARLGFDGEELRIGVETNRVNRGLQHIVMLDTGPVRVEILAIEDDQISAKVDGKLTRATLFCKGGSLTIFSTIGSYEYSVIDPLDISVDGGQSDGQIVAPMPGLIKQVNCKAGDKVEAGDSLIILEAMKMEHTLSAPRSGTIAELLVSKNDQVDEGAVLVVMEDDDE